jgi:hypothetical protein
MQMTPIVMVLLIALAVFWIYQFTFLMSLEDNMFFAKHDKVLWCVAFILAPALAPFAFLVWKRAKRLTSN